MYEQPICQAFTTNPTFAGGAKEAVGLNCLLALVTFMATNNFFLMIIFLITHKFIVNLTKHDDKFMIGFIRHLKFKEVYY